MTSNSDASSREKMLDLMREKDQLDRKIQDLGMILEANKVGMNEPLVTDDGFPRSDIDVAAIRHARHDIICLQNDRRALYEKIYKELGDFHDRHLPAQSNGHNVNKHGPEVMDVVETCNVPTLIPFIKVETIVPGLGADRSGLQVGDQILRMGSITASNFKSMQQIKTILENSAGRAVRLLVRKADTGSDDIVNVFPPNLGILFALCANK